MWPVYMIMTVKTKWKKYLYQTVNLAVWFHNLIMQNNFYVIKLEMLSHENKSNMIILELINFKQIAKMSTWFSSMIIKQGGQSENNRHIFRVYLINKGK